MASSPVLAAVARPSPLRMAAPSPFAVKAAQAAAQQHRDQPHAQMDLIPALHGTQSPDGASPESSAASTTSSSANSQMRAARRSFKSSLLACMCLRPQVSDSKAAEPSSPAGAGAAPSGNMMPAQRMPWHQGAFASSIGKHVSTAALIKQASAAFSDAGSWCDARSEFSTALSSAASDQGAKLEELSAMLRELHHTPTPLPAALPVPPAAAKAPWIPEPALAFGTPGMRFVPVLAVTGFAAYWERDSERSTPYPMPIDVMCKASTLVHKVHQSIPGIWLQESDGSFSITVKPSFMPPGLPRYTEAFDKSMRTTPSTPMRRDLRLGSTAGQIFMTSEGMLILRATFRSLFGKPEFIMEEYMRLEEGGTVIVDYQCCLDVKTGKRCTQYLVGRRHAVPPKGAV